MENNTLKNEDDYGDMNRCKVYLSCQTFGQAKYVHKSQRIRRNSICFAQIKKYMISDPARAAFSSSVQGLGHVAFYTDIIACQF